jgi:predicted ATPase
MTDTVTNWFERMPKKYKAAKRADPTYPKHLIKPNSMMLVIGPTGIGKTNAVVEFLNRKNEQCFEIIIFTGSSSDEPLYQFLQGFIDGLKITDNIAELPKIDDYKDSDNKDLEKLIIFDDSCMMDVKILKEIQKWFMCARKLGFTCIFLSQDYTSTPIFIRRNVHYLLIFKLTDTLDVNRILSKHAMDTDVHTLKGM